MKTASEVAEEIMRWDVPAGVSYNLPETIEAKRSFIAQALTAYADERVKEDRHNYSDRYDSLVDGIRAEALEEAAKILENHGCTDCTEAIRALEVPRK